ncbi:hypothetical protein F2P56_000015 [Juglans regia]|uniref:Uncharacterized protein n=2 Tax=Juglans regia TaxID=51240 RepID=A0A834D998_JUGRE|nr:extracellular ribonuclease LE-like isoform X3 [Juglans regia]KAF5479166.1 hypothetical protein F2P56_000015 [Juglans regia]
MPLLLSPYHSSFSVVSNSTPRLLSWILWTSWLHIAWLARLLEREREREMKGTYGMLIVIFMFQIHQAAVCGTQLHNVSKFVQKWQVPVASAGRKYDFIYLVQQWQISLCNIKSCLKPARPAFSIHGLWPSTYSTKTPSNCTATVSKFAPQKISDLKDRLDMEWPSLLQESNYELWKEEWESHGSCSQAMLPQHAFFETALRLKEKYKLQEMLAEKDIYPFGNLYRLDGIIDAIATATGHKPQIQCSLYKQVPLLSNVFLCFDYNATNIIDCPVKKRCRYDEIMIPYYMFGSRRN